VNTVSRTNSRNSDPWTLASARRAAGIEHRDSPERDVDRLNEGSYLTFAIANRWISRLSYVYPVCPWYEYSERRAERFEGRPSDLHEFLCRNKDFKSGFIELIHIT
jgi:hypothetical protein